MDAHEKLDYIDTGIDYNGNQFKSQDMWGDIQYNPTSDIFTINGHVTTCKNIKYWAAAPMWRNSSYSGSGLPYPNHFVAYENTPNTGTVQVTDGLFQIQLLHPSEYYVNQGKRLLKPHVHLELVELNKVITLVVGDYLLFRALKNLPNHPTRTIGR